MEPKSGEGVRTFYAGGVETGSDRASCRYQAHMGSAPDTVRGLIATFWSPMDVGSPMRL